MTRPRNGRLDGYQYYDEVEQRMLTYGKDPYKVVEYVSYDGKNPEGANGMPWNKGQPAEKIFNKRYNNPSNPYGQMQDEFLKKHKIEEFNEFITDDKKATENQQIMDRANRLFNNYEEAKKRPIGKIQDKEKMQFEKDKNFLQNNLPKQGNINFFSLGAPGAGKETTLRQLDVKINKNNSTDQYRSLLTKNNKKISHPTSVFFTNNNARAIRDNIENKIITEQQKNQQNISINHDTPGMTNSMTDFFPKYKQLQQDNKAKNIAFWIYTPFNETLKRVYHRQQYNGMAIGPDWVSFCFNNAINGHKDIIEKLQPNQTYIIDNSKNCGYPIICASMLKNGRSDVRIHNLDSFLSFVQSMNENLIYGTTDPVPVYKKYTYKEQNEKERILVGLKNFCKLYGKCSYENIQFSLENNKLVVKDKYKNSNIAVNSFNNLGFNSKTKDILNYIIKRQNMNKNKVNIQDINNKAFIKKYGRPINKNTKQNIYNVYKGPKIVNIGK